MIYMEGEQNRVQRLLKKWIPLLGLDRWRIKAHYLDQPTNGAIFADTTTEWQYMLATIRFYLPAVAQVDDDELEQGVLHELMHVLLDETTPDESTDAEERVVEQLAWAFRNVGRGLAKGS